jgi:hypothetical protein
MPPRLRASDYAKGKISQDEIIALQIANDANISKARKAIKMGEVQQLTPMESASPEELLADDAAQEAIAMSNIKKLGFRDQEASAIITNMRNEANLNFATLNANFPAIQEDIKKRFNIKLLTPTFFIEYLKKYADEIDDATGLKNVFNVNNGGLNNLVNNVAELRQVIPDPNVIEFIRRAAQDSRAVGQMNLNELTRLRNLLPSAADLQALANVAPVQQQRIIDQLLVQFQNMPSAADLRDIANAIQADELDRRQFQDEIRNIVNAIPQGRQVNVVQMSLGLPEEGSVSPLTAMSVPSSPTGVASLISQVVGGRPLNPRQKKAIDDYSVSGGRDIEPAYKELEKEFGVQGASNISGILAQQKQLSSMGGISGITTPPLVLDSSLQLGKVGGIKAMKNTLRENPDMAANLINRKTNTIMDVDDLAITSNLAPNSRKVFWRDTNIIDLFKEKFGKGFHPSSLPSLPMGSKRKMVKVGRGLAVKETPSYREYGKYAIHIPQLEQQDILNVKYKSLGQIPKFRPIPVSDVFRDFILDLIENGKPNARVYTQICPNERKFFEEMSIGAGVWNSLGLKRTTTSTDEEEAKQFELLKGEYIAGNNNPKVISELRRLVVKMMSDGRIRRNQGVELLMELSI